MKHIKEYNTYSKIEELEDYLQEFFDKHSITLLSEYKGEMVHRDDIVYEVVSDSIILYNILPYQRIEKICTELDTLLPKIEKRLGYELNKSISQYIISINLGSKTTL